MSPSRESIVFIVLANLVFTVVVVAGAMAIFKGDGAQGEDRALRGLEERVARIESARSGEEPQLTPAELALQSEIRSLSERQAELVARLEQLEKSPRAVAGSGEEVDLADPDEAAATDKPPSPAEAMMKMMNRMWLDRLKRERDRYIDSILNPTPESEARQDRMFRGIARRAAQNLGLDDQQAAQLEEILLEVDDARRDRFRDLIAASGGSENVTYEDVDQVLKESFEEEDRRVSQSLPREKADQYKREAEPVRGMMSSMAKSMFEGEDK
jgi:hypothetical protein